MKKSVTKLTLNKITISNLDSSEMNRKLGGWMAKGKTVTRSVIIDCTSSNNCPTFPTNC